MAVIPAAQLGASRFVSFDPDEGVLAAAAPDGTVQNLLVAHPDTGGVTHLTCAAGGAHAFQDAAGNEIATLAAEAVAAAGEVLARGTLNVREWGNLLHRPDVFPAASHTHDLADITGMPTTLGGYGITDAVPGSDPRLSDARAPTAHATTHAAAGSDPLSLAMSQVAGLNAAIAGREPALGLPSEDGYVLTSTAAGLRSWVPAAGAAGGSPAGGGSSGGGPWVTRVDGVTPGANGWVVQGGTWIDAAGVVSQTAAGAVSSMLWLNRTPANGALVYSIEWEHRLDAIPTEGSYLDTAVMLSYGNGPGHEDGVFAGLQRQSSGLWELVMSRTNIGGVAVATIAAPVAGQWYSFRLTRVDDQLALYMDGALALVASWPVNLAARTQPVLRSHNVTVSFRGVKVHTLATPAESAAGGQYVAMPAFPSINGVWARGRAEDLTAASGAAVASWTDASGNGRHAVGSGTMVRESALGGRAAVQLNGTGNYYALPALPAFFRVYVVLRVRSGGSPYRSIIGGVAGAPDLYIAQNTDFLELSSSQTVLKASSGVAVPQDTTVIAGVKVIAGEATFFLGPRGGAIGPFPTSGGFSAGAAYIGQSNPSASFQFLRGDVAEWVVLDASATDDDEARVLSYFASAYRGS
ncbi:MAG TPA: hypothetical protein VFH27_10850 [Longimicrobiaceae bacterium]|nr:hypothetical protein [Longimicrobiaceae bacterium]